MLGWMTSRVMTSITVLVIAGSFLGLFTMQADHYRMLELEDLADAVTGLVTEVDLLTCEARVEVNWTSSPEARGLPRDFHGEPYLIQFSSERPYLVWQGTRVAGRFFPTPVELLDADGEATTLLEVPSSTGFVIESSSEWGERGMEHPIAISPLP